MDDVQREEQVTLHRKFWALFSLHQYFLEEGDVCVFELKQGEAFASFVFHIFRVVAILSADRSNSHYDVRKLV